MDVPNLADAVVTLLTPQLPARGTIERVWVPRRELSAIKTAGVAFLEVVPGMQTTSWQGRQFWAKDQRIQVGVWQPIDNASEKAEVDAAVIVVDGLADWLRENPSGHTWSTAVEVALVDVQIDPLFDPKILDEQGLFASVITATYRMGHP